MGKVDPTLQLQTILNIKKQTETVVSEVSSFVGNPVCLFKFYSASIMMGHSPTTAILRVGGGLDKFKLGEYLTEAISPSPWKVDKE